MRKFTAVFLAVIASVLQIAAGEEQLWPTPGTWGTVYFGYQNAKKEWVIPPRFTQAKPFREGVAPVKEEGRWQVIDRSGKMLFAFGDDWSIADMEPYSEGYAVVTYGLEGFSCLVDRKGKRLSESQTVVTHAGSFSDGLAAFSNYAAHREKAIFGYVDRDGKVVIPPRFRFAGPFVDGIAPVIQEDGSVWFIGKDGAGKTKFDGVDFAGALRKGRAAAHVAATNTWGFVDGEGRMAIPFQFAEVRGFFEDLAAAKVPGNRGWGYLDRTGKAVIAHQFDVAESFDQGRAWVIVKGDRCAIDLSGNVVWSMNTEIPRDFKSPMDYLPKKVLPPEALVVADSPLGEPTAFLERIPSMKGAVASTRTAGECDIREYGFMRNRLRLFVKNNLVTRLELVALVRNPKEAKNTVQMRLQPGVGLVPVKGTSINIEAEQSAALEVVTSALSVAGKTAYEDEIRNWVLGLWQPPGTTKKVINGREFFSRVANFSPWEAMGTDREGQLIMISCDSSSAAGFASPATELPLWLIGVWAEQRNYSPTTEIELSDQTLATFVPKEASVDRQPRNIREAIDSAFQIAENQVVISTTILAKGQQQNRNVVVGRLQPNVLQFGGPGGIGYQQVPMRIGFNLKQVNTQVVVDTVYRGYAFHAAGLRSGDILQAIDGAPVATVDEALKPFSDKSKVAFEVSYSRDGQTNTTTVKVKPAP